MAILLYTIVFFLTQGRVPAGEWALDPARSDDINAVIDRSTADMNFIKRPIARHRLRATNPAPRNLSIREHGDSIDVILNSDVVLHTAPGAHFKWRYNGEDLTVDTSVRNGVLHNTFTAGDGVKQNEYRLRDDGMLELRVHLSSPQLKHDVDYVEVFRRK